MYPPDLVVAVVVFLMSLTDVDLENVDSLDGDRLIAVVEPLIEGKLTKQWLVVAICRCGTGQCWSIMQSEARGKTVGGLRCRLECR